MKYGVTFPWLEPRTVAQLAQEAETAGWDGIFYWDGLDIAKHPSYNAWITLAAAAMSTKRVKLGTMLTALARRKPWELARETVTLDHLAKGRFILSVGLGAQDDGAFSRFGEQLDRKTRAERLDEGLDILLGLWSGQPFKYQGKHYHIDETAFAPMAVQSPRIPIWVVGAWPREKSMQRVARYDGLLPNMLDDAGKPATFTGQDIRAMKAYVEARRTLTTPFDIVVEGETPGDDPDKARATIREWADGGVTWWLEDVWASAYEKGGVEGIRRRIQQGPPRPDG